MVQRFDVQLILGELAEPTFDLQRFTAGLPIGQPNAHRHGSVVPGAVGAIEVEALPSGLAHHVHGLGVEGARSPLASLEATPVAREGRGLDVQRRLEAGLCEEELVQWLPFLGDLVDKHGDEGGDVPRRIPNGAHADDVVRLLIEHLPKLLGDAVVIRPWPDPASGQPHLEGMQDHLPCA